MFPVWDNTAFIVLSDFFSQTGRAEWLDKGHRKCLTLWHRIPEWADIIQDFVSLDLMFMIILFSQAYYNFC